MSKEALPLEWPQMRQVMRSEILVPGFVPCMLSAHQAAQLSQRLVPAIWRMYPGLFRCCRVMKGRHDVIYHSSSVQELECNAKCTISSDLNQRAISVCADCNAHNDWKTHATIMPLQVVECIVTCCSQKHSELQKHWESCTVRRDSPQRCLIHAQDCGQHQCRNRLCIRYHCV